MIDDDKQGPLIGELSESLEDYIEIIFNLIETHKIARVRDIARAKDVKMSSVVSALKRLGQTGLVKYEAREFVELTDSGSDLARWNTRSARRRCKDCTNSRNIYRKAQPTLKNLLTVFIIKASDIF